MSYLVLARKHRPQTFGSLIGQEHISKALANAILTDRVPHAFLFTGPRGVGKTSSARILAKALNCTGRKNSKDVEPCGECTNCIEISRSSSLAVWEIDGASNNSVDNVRDLIDSLRSAPPPNSKYKIYIIDEVHMLSTAAFNALLKSLEEPPANTIFVFATTDPQKIPETVISRCQRHDFRQLSPDAIKGSLEEIAKLEKVKVESGVFDLIAKKAEGGMRDAQSMFDRLLAFSSGEIKLEEARNIFGVVDDAFFLELSTKILEQNSLICFELINKAFSESIDIRAFAADFLLHWRNLLLAAHLIEKKAEAKQISKVLEIEESKAEAIQKLLEDSSSFQIARLFDLAEKTTNSILSGHFPRYAFEAGIAKMSTLPDLRPLPEIINSLKSGKIAEAPVVKKKSTEPKIKTTVVPKIQTEEAPSEPVASNTETESEKIPEFNPSWENFLAHVRSRSEMVLGAFLRRVNAKEFHAGKLEIESSKFDVETIQKKEMYESLSNCLYSYSGRQNWEINFSEVTNPPLASDKNNNKNDFTPGSIEAKEKTANIEKEKQMINEAKNDELTKSILEAFDGSKIARVSLVDKK